MPVDNQTINNVSSENVKEQYMKQIEAMQQIDLLLKQVLAPEAKERLNNIRLVNQKMYMAVAQYLIQLYQQGQIRGVVNDNMLKQIIMQLQPKKEIRIRRK